MTRRRHDDDALALAIERAEFERVAIWLLLGVAEVARTLPPATIDDLLALLSAADAGSPDSNNAGSRR